MKQIMTVGAALVVWILMASGDLAAQHQMGGQMQMEGQAGQQGQTGFQQPMMGMMCPMMSGGMGMMGMMGSGQTDPKTMGRMLQLRGDILKAIGEVMLKHGKTMEEAK